LRLTGADHEGIVHEVSGYLAGRGVNFETMETNVLAAPVSGSPLFHLDAQISAPAQLPLSDLQANLDRIADDQGVDIEVFPRGQ
jgi:glycine cleavage system transcriptional repressor